MTGLQKQSAVLSVTIISICLSTMATSWLKGVTVTITLILRLTHSTRDDSRILGFSGLKAPILPMLVIMLLGRTMTSTLIFAGSIPTCYWRYAMMAAGWSISEAPPMGTIFQSLTPMTPFQTVGRSTT